MSGRTVRILASVAALGVCSGSGLAQVTDESEDLGLVFQRLEQQDRQAREDGFLLESFPVQQLANDPRRKSMTLSFGEVGGTSGGSAFDDESSRYLLDPLTPIEAPPVGLNLKLQF
ncbi:MAG TPA: hypothetical protein VMO81_02650 [Aestuariivirgaceae bacterium]|nr:hypothetical protein [Aestuariivirgaceae bacterium]